MNGRGFKYLIITLGTLITPGLLLAVSATLKPLRGNVYIQHPQKDLWEHVKAPVAVEEGDRIKTNNDSSAFLILPDDHRVAIGADSFLKLERIAQGETKIYLKTGSLRNKVRHLQLDLGQYYKVQTPAAVCAVRGTDFAVVQKAQARQVNVHVFEGIVDLSALRKDVASAVTHLQAGHSATMDGTGHVETVTRTGPPTNGKEPKQADPPAKAPSSKEDPPSSHKGPPPPGSGGTPPVNLPSGNNGPNATDGPSWYDRPESISQDTFKPTFTLPGTMGPDPNGPSHSAGDNSTYDNTSESYARGPNPNEPEGNTWSSFNPLSGTGFDPLHTGMDPNNPSGSGPNTYYPPPTGNNPPPPTNNDPGAVGNQALFDTLASMNLMGTLQGLQVADLFKDGSVKLGPDGQMHQYADAIQTHGADGVKFLNATMVGSQPHTLNYQVATIKFNQNLPTAPDAYKIATQTAFRGDFGTTPPAYYATNVNNYRSNTVDYVAVEATGGQLLFNSAAPRYYTDFTGGRCVVNGTELWSKTSGVYSYLGGPPPTMYPSSSPGSADSAFNNVYAGGVTLGRRVTYFNPATGQIATPTSIPSTMTAQQYLGSPDLVVQDTLFSNLFTHGPIVGFGSAQSRIFGGIDSVVNNADAANLLNGAQPVGLPDGLIRM